MARKDLVDSANNMRLWEDVTTIETKYTKPAKVGGQEITAISGTAMFMMATREFGPCGIGWGANIIEERFDEGAEMYKGEGDKRVVLGRELNHTVRIKFWYMLDGKRGEIEQYGCTEYLYLTSFGKLKTDGEAPKKSLTDAIKKSLSMLGFAADVYLGMHDNPEFIEAQMAEERIEAAVDKVAEKEAQAEERLKLIASTIELMNSSGSLREAKKIHDSQVRRFAAKDDTKAVLRLKEELDAITAKFGELDKQGRLAK